VTIAQHSRATVSPRETLGTGDDPSHDFSAFVWAENYVQYPTPHTYFYEVPIIIERPMYFNYKGIWTGGHDVVGFHY